MAVPRKISVIATKYFDILFCSQSEQTAFLLKEKADEIYEKSLQYLKIENTLRIPVVITPDSEVLEVSYSPIPYNRIVLYEGIPSENQIENNQTLLTLFEHEVIRAINESYRSPFIQKIYNIVHVDSFQPVAMLNLSFSFIEAFTNICEGKTDREFLQILSQAKIEGEFPSWFQVFANRDTEPGNELSLAAATAFTAYIQQRWGFEKYQEFWKECGKLHLMLTPGVFYKVYGEKLEDEWKLFEQSVPAPQKLDDFYEQEQNITKLFTNDSESRYESLLATEYGFIWYDSIRHEVDIYDPYIPIKIRQLLFLADSIDKLSLSPDGRFMAVTYTGYQNRSNFQTKLTRIYDIKNRCYVSKRFKIRDATIIILPDGDYGIAGINVEKNIPVLQVYKAGELCNTLLKEKNLPFDKRKTEVLFEKKYESSNVPINLVYAGQGKLNFLIRNNKMWNFCQLDLETSTEKYWCIQGIELKNLSYAKTFQNRKSVTPLKNEIYTFEYTPENNNAFTRMGYIEFNSNYEPENIYLQQNELSVGGGVHSPVIKNNKVYYSLRNLTYDSFVSIPFSNFEFSKESVDEILVKEQIFEDVVVARENKLNIKRYNPLNYCKLGAVYPFFPVKSLELENGPKLWPGLGLTFENETDAFDNTQIVLSASYALAKLDYSTLRNPSADEILEMEENTVSNTDYSFVGYIKNTSLPVDLSLGSTFRFNDNGFYDLRLLAGTAVNFPLGMTFRNLRLSLQIENAYSTSYYDKLQASLKPEKQGWINFFDSYRFLELSFLTEYTNYAQYGPSPFEMRGIKIKNKLYYFWDYETQKSNNLNSSLSVTIGIPRLTPFQMYNGWIFSAPATVNAEFMGKNGTALETYTEILLLGREVQNGFPFLYLYFNRFGIKAGYDLSLNYDTNTVSLPDIREIARFVNIFEHTHIYDCFYLKFNLDFIPPIGRLSTAILCSEAKIAYYPRSEGFTFSISVDVKM